MARQLTEEQKQRRRQQGRERYANNPKIRARYQEKARARIPEKCEYEKGRRRKVAEQEGRTWKDKAGPKNHVFAMIMDSYKSEAIRQKRADNKWHRHPECLRFYSAAAARSQWEKRKSEPGYRQLKSLRCRLWKFAKGIGSLSMRSLIGCSMDQLRGRLERMFTKGMGWHNYGEWEIDHVVPCSAFNLLDEQQQRACFHYSNLQPMWKAENIRKGNRIRQCQPELALAIS